MNCVFALVSGLRAAFFASLIAISSILGGAEMALAQNRWAPTNPNFQTHRELSYNFIIENLQHPDIAAGAVIASPSRLEPNYFHHWVRDAGLTMNTVVTHEFLSSSMPSFANWANFEMSLQKTSREQGVGLGEPVFEVDGSLYAQPWGRPQNDGPAIRALTMIQAYNNYLQLGQTPSPNLRDSIAADLDHVATHYNAQSFDLWEEVKGLHFFTALLQWKALKKGATWAVANGLGDLGARLASQIAPLTQQLEGHLDPVQNRWRITVQQTEGWGHKVSGLDVAVLLAYLYFQEEAPFTIDDIRLANTVALLEQQFGSLYPINSPASGLPPAIGRYPEDVYDGHGFSGGNPWFLATAAMGEYHCRLGRRHLVNEPLLYNPVLNFADAFIEKIRQGVSLFSVHSVTNQQQSGNQELARGQAYLERVLLHAGPDLNMSEQFNRSTGFRQGARSLTWSFSALYRASAACDLNYDFSVFTQ